MKVMCAAAFCFDHATYTHQDVRFGGTKKECKVDLCEFHYGLMINDEPVLILSNSALGYKEDTLLN